MVSGALETLTAGGSVVAPAGEVRAGRVESDAAGGGRPPGTHPDRRTGAARPDRVARAWIRYDSGQAIPVKLDQLRLDHFAGSVPWRRFRSRHGQAHLSGEYFAATTGGHLIYESRLELARLLLADFDRDVAGIYAQPCRLVAWVGGRQRCHVPDFLLASPEGVVTVVNVKPADRVVDPVVAEALAWPGDLVRQRGWRYEVWSGCDPVVLDNVRFLAGYRRSWVASAETVDAACRAAGEGEQLAVVERRLADGAPPHAVRTAVLAALWQGRLVTDLNRPLSGSSMLRRPR